MAILDSLSTLKKSLSALNVAVLSLSTEDRSLMDMWGWQYPPVTRYDLGDIANRISMALEMFQIAEEDEEFEELLDDITSKINNLRTSIIPHFFIGNSNTISAVGVYIQTLTVVRSLLDPYIGWDIVAQKEMMPKHLSKKIKAIDGRINSLSPEMESLEAKVIAINEASEAADSLPTDMEELRKAREQVEGVLGSITTSQKAIETLENKAKKSTEAIVSNEGVSEKSVKKIDEHLQIATTNGLAGAFKERAQELKRTVWYWVTFLAGSLWLGMYAAHSNLSALNVALGSGNTNSIAVNIVLSLLSVGGSVWFAWISTKQIGQRFRLAEDYAFKASVAMAYEGYRQEAVRIDEVFEARLFASTLTRLEEAPLRLIEDTTHGSPFHEFFGSEGFKKALETIPEFKRDLIGLLKNNKLNDTDPISKKNAETKQSDKVKDDEE